MMTSAYLDDITCILLDITSTKVMKDFGGVTCQSDVTSGKKRQLINHDNS